MIRTDATTQYDGATGIKDLSPPDLIEAEREPGKAAAKIRKIVFTLPPGVEISTQELIKIMTGGEPYTLIDARPVKRFGNAHIPSAIAAHPKDDNFLSLLPENRENLLIFYCGGPTCPYTGMSVEKAQQAGYTNVKGYQSGLPIWKKSKLPVHSEPAWLAKNLNPQRVILDVRDKEAATDAIKEAVHIPLEQLEDRIGELPTDKEIILYCANGIRAEMAHQTLDKKGIKNRFLNEYIVIDKNGQYKM